MSKYEGCGEVGSIRGIFLAQFHPHQGPMVRCQWPPDVLCKETFGSLSRFIIPKNEVQEQTITVNALGYKISGYPTYLKDKKYPRNYLLFNLCIVCHPWSRTVQFEPFVRKLSQFFVNLEKESELLSRDTEEGSQTTNKIRDMLEHVYRDINSKGRTILVCGKNSLPLSSISLGSDPSPVQDYQVPILVVYTFKFDPDQWDLTTTQILPYIDGFNHVAKIAALADVEPNLVRACVQTLLYHRVVAVVPIFQYSNVYTVTPEFATARDDPAFREEVLEGFTRFPNGATPSIRDIYSFIAAFTYGTTLKDICLRFVPSKLGFDERRLVQYLVLKGVLRRVHKYPVYMGEGSSSSSSSLYTYLNGRHHTDEICVRSGLSAHQLDVRLETDPNIILLWR